jgi:plastocyanin
LWIALLSERFGYAWAKTHADSDSSAMEFIEVWRLNMKCFTPTLLTALVALAPLSFVTAEPPEIAVQMTQAKSFEPKTIKVKTGDTVVWKNVSDMPHSVTDVPSLAATPEDAALPPNAKEFDSGLISPGKDYSHTFTVPGTYKYFCIPHEAAGMVGTVIVSK